MRGMWTDLYLNKGPRKSRFFLNLTDRQTDKLRTDRQMDFGIHRVASLLKINGQTAKVSYRADIQ